MKNGVADFGISPFHLRLSKGAIAGSEVLLQEASELLAIFASNGKRLRA